MPTNVMLAHKYKGTNVDGWYMSEKLDGVRAIWDGATLRSRNNKPIHAPMWFLAGLPKGVILDGELWSGRENFQQLVSTVRKKVPIDLEWEAVIYQVFDVIEPGIFLSRYYHILDLPESAIISIVPHHVITSTEVLSEFYEYMLLRKAEGVMIRNPHSMYEFRRSNNLLKLKPSISDEATVIDYQEGEGKYTNMLGALICQWKNKIIYLGTGFDDSQRCSPPAKGSIVTFKYQHLTNDNMPRFPVFLAVRNYE